MANNRDSRMRKNKKFKMPIFASFPIGDEVETLEALSAQDLIRQIEQMILDGEIPKEYLENPQDEVRGYPAGTKPRFVIP
jgi:hypothetical protein